MLTYLAYYQSARQPTSNVGKRMPEGFLTHCKAALSNLIASDSVQSADDLLQAFSDGIRA